MKNHKSYSRQGVSPSKLFLPMNSCRGSRAVLIKSKQEGKMKTKTEKELEEAKKFMSEVSRTKRMDWRGYSIEEWMVLFSQKAKQEFNEKLEDFRKSMVKRLKDMQTDEVKKDKIASKFLEDLYIRPLNEEINKIFKEEKSK